MSKIKIITDSNSGILQSEAKDLGIFVIPMPFTIDGEEYLEEISISQEKFYEFLEKGADVKTSQPSRFYLEELFTELLKDNDELIYIPMSSGLSGTCQNATVLAQEFNGRVKVVDNLRISVMQKESVMEAVKMVELGKTADEIKQYLEETKLNNSIYLTVSVLKYLKKGGRISSAAAALGAMLNVKPIMYSNGGKFEKFGMTISFTQAKKKMLAQIKHEVQTKFKEAYNNKTLCVYVAHTKSHKEAEVFKQEILKELPDVQFRFLDPLSLSVSCHIGPGALGIGLCVNNYLK